MRMPASPRQAMRTTCMYAQVSRVSAAVGHSLWVQQPSTAPHNPGPQVYSTYARSHLYFAAEMIAMLALLALVGSHVSWPRWPALAALDAGSRALGRAIKARAFLPANAGRS